MAPKRKPAAGKATPKPKLAAHNFLPMFTKNGKLLDEERAVAWLTRLPSPPHQRLPRR